MRATGVEGFLSSPPLEELHRESGVVVSEPNLGVPFDGRVVEARTAPMLTPGVSTGVVAGPARSRGWKVGAKVRLVPPGVSAVEKMCVFA